MSVCYIPQHVEPTADTIDDFLKSSRYPGWSVVRTEPLFFDDEKANGVRNVLVTDGKDTAKVWLYFEDRRGVFQMRDIAKVLQAQRGRT